MKNHHSLPNKKSSNLKKTASTYELRYSERYDIYLIKQKPEEDQNGEEQEEDIEKNPHETKSILELLTEKEILAPKKELSALEEILQNYDLNQEANQTEYIQNNKSPYKKFENYLDSLTTSSYQAETDPASGAKIFYVPGAFLPPNTAGMYVPSTNTIYVSLDQSPHEIQITKHHEIYHARYGSDENLAEAYGQRMAA